MQSLIRIGAVALMLIGVFFAGGKTEQVLHQPNHKPVQVDPKSGHTVSTLVFTCMDFRFQAQIAAWMHEQFEDKADHMVWPGVSGGFNKPHDPEELLQIIEMAHKLHHIKTVCLVNHRDCGGHGGSGRHSSPEAEKEYHVKDMRKAATVIRERFPNIEVRLFFEDYDGISEVPKM